MLSFSMKGGTRPTKNLCESCKMSKIIKGPQQGQEIITCYAVGYGANVPFPVVECNKYVDTIAQSRYDMEQIAWLVEIKNNKVIGFKSPLKRKEDHEL